MSGPKAQKAWSALPTGRGRGSVLLVADAKESEARTHRAARLTSTRRTGPAAASGAVQRLRGSRQTQLCTSSDDQLGALEQATSAVRRYTSKWQLDDRRTFAGQPGIRAVLNNPATPSSVRAVHSGSRVNTGPSQRTKEDQAIFFSRSTRDVGTDRPSASTRAWRKRFSRPLSACAAGVGHDARRAARALV